MRAPTWDLSSIAPQGVTSARFAARVDAAAEELQALRARTEALGALGDHLDAWVVVLADEERLQTELRELYCAAHCAAAAATDCADTRHVASRVAETLGSAHSVEAAWTAQVDAADDDTFAAFVSRAGHRDIELVHARAESRLRLPPAEQALLGDLDREAKDAWGELHGLVSGSLTGPLTEHGATRAAPISELDSLVHGHPDRTLRQAAFAGWTAAWASQQDICAHALTQLVGTRQTRQDRVGIDPLAATAIHNRTRPETIRAVWAAADARLPSLRRYLQRKAQLLGLKHLEWSDTAAPLPSTGAQYTWEQAQAVILDGFGGFAPPLRDFAAHAFADRWVDAEARPGKRHGAFCAGFPKTRQSRVFLTFTGSGNNVVMLAHELGHAWHNALLLRSPPSRHRITSALSETASTFAETIVRHRLIDQAGPDDQLALLDLRLQAAVANLCNIAARFTFEERLYALRRQGPLRAAQLNGEMAAAQRRAHGDALGSYDPLQWASKPHYYNTHLTFYNWTFTFGFLFSSAMHARALDEGAPFFDTLQDVLMRSGWQDTEALAHAALGVDLTDPEFWVAASEPIEQDVQRFMELSAKATPEV